MVKKLSLISLILLILPGSVAFGKAYRAANGDLRGLYVTTPEEVMELGASEIDLATAVLISSELWDENVQGRNDLATVEKMASDIWKRLEKKNIPLDARAIEVINKYLFDELGYRSVETADDPEDLFLHKVLKTRRGYCLSLSVLYLSIGERLGLPLYGMVVPGHFFVRYDDGETAFNIETTGKGAIVGDEYYLNKFKVPSVGRSIYMQPLNKRQSLGCFFNNLGNSYSNRGDDAEAILAFEKAVYINPGLAESQMNLGNLYLRGGRAEEAIKRYRLAAEINPYDAKIFSNLGNAYGQLGWLNEAIGVYSQAIVLDPNYVDAYTNLAIAYADAKFYNKAVEQLNIALDLNGGRDAVLYGRIGDVYCRMENFEKAKHYFERALKLNPRYAYGYYGLGYCLGQLELDERALSAYERASSLDPEMTSALSMAGNIYFERGDFALAAKKYEKICELLPQSADMRFNLAITYARNEEWAKAASEYERVVKLNGKMADAQKGLCVAYYQLEEYEKAWKQVQRAEKEGCVIPEDILQAIKAKVD